METTLTVNGTGYRLLRLLGRGKGGYSYLAERGGGLVVLKQLHHEPCSYYTFGDKFAAELHDYQRLCRAGVRVPGLLDAERGTERLVKEYIDGPTVMELLRRGGSAAPYLPQVREMAALARAAGLNIDYFPTNFVENAGLLWYVDYECNEYREEWSFETWGVKYWSRTPELLEYWRQQEQNAAE